MDSIFLTAGGYGGENVLNDLLLRVPVNCTPEEMVGVNWGHST